jgi:hypothetical protein
MLLRASSSGFSCSTSPVGLAMQEKSLLGAGRGSQGTAPQRPTIRQLGWGAGDGDSEGVDTTQSSLTDVTTDSLRSPSQPVSCPSSCQDHLIKFTNSPSTPSFTSTPHLRPCSYGSFVQNINFCKKNEQTRQDVIHVLKKY